jgi:hypothetical protein
VFWKLLLLVGGTGTAYAGGNALYRKFAHHEQSGKKPIAPPGAAQTGTTVATPPSPGAKDGDALHSAARVALTALATNGATQVALPGVSAFQVAYNATKPPVKLKTDGKYGAKTAAALQATIAPATAPSPLFGSTNGAPPPKVAPTPIPAATPLPGLTDVTGAANALASLVVIPKTSDPRVSAFQAAYNRTPNITHLVQDGKYGGSTQGALQAVLDYMGAGQTAPQNLFGPVVAEPSYPPDADVLELG